MVYLHNETHFRHKKVILILEIKDVLKFKTILEDRIFQLQKKLDGPTIKSEFRKNTEQILALNKEYYRILQRDRERGLV